MVQVPTRHGKADLEIYRAAGTMDRPTMVTWHGCYLKRSIADALYYATAGAEVVNILTRGGVTERASVDEAYVDVTVCCPQLHALAGFSRSL